MSTLRTSIQLLVKGTQTNPLDLSSAESDTLLQTIIDLLNGVGLDQANVIWGDTRTLAPSASDSLDLVGGGLVDPFGAVIAPARIKGIFIVAAKNNLNNLTLFGDAAHVPVLNTVATTLTLKPGGMFAFVDPSAAGVLVTAGTGDLIKITNAAGTNSVTYQIIIVGGAT